MKKLLIAMCLGIGILGYGGTCEASTIIDVDTSITDDLTNGGGAETDDISSSDSIETTENIDVSTEDSSDNDKVDNSGSAETTTEDAFADNASDDPFNLLPEVDEKGFVENFFAKLKSGLNIFQVFAGILIFIAFICFAVAAVFSFLGTRNRLLYWIFAMIICVILFFVVVYIFEIFAAFKLWINS